MEDWRLNTSDGVAEDPHSKTLAWISEHHKKINEKTKKNLSRKIEEIEDFSIRALNCMRNDNIVFIGDLVQEVGERAVQNP